MVLITMDPHNEALKEIGPIYAPVWRTPWATNHDFNPLVGCFSTMSCLNTQNLARTARFYIHFLRFSYHDFRGPDAMGNE
jgi:hypothetical protein